MKLRPTEPSDDELVALHFKDAMNTPEEELPEGEELEEETEEEPGANAAPVVPTPLAPAPTGRKRGRPPGGHRKDRATGVGKDTSAGAGMPLHGEGNVPWPTNALEVWDKIVNEFAASLGRGPQDIYITVYRFGVGTQSGQPVTKDRLYIARIDGLSVAGSEVQSPGEALAEYMETVVHPSAGYPARYELYFQWRRGGTIKTGDMTFGSPQEIAQQRAFAAEHAARSAAGFGGPPRSMGHYVVPPPQPHPQSYYPPQSFQPPPYYPPPASQDSGEVAAMRRDLATVLGRFDEMNRRDAEARGQPVPPPIAPQVVPPPVESEDARMARLLDAALERRGVGARPVSVAAPAAIAQTGSAGVVEQAKAGIGALREFMGMFKELDKFRREVGLGGVESGETVVEIPPPTVEDPNSPAFGVRPIPFSNFQGKPVMWPKPQLDEDGNEVEESLLAKLMKFAAANPDLSLAVLERASKVLSQGAFAQLLQSFTQLGGPAAQAAATMADRVAAGVAAPNGAPPPTGYPSP